MITFESAIMIIALVIGFAVLLVLAGFIVLLIFWYIPRFIIFIIDKILNKRKG